MKKMELDNEIRNDWDITPDGVATSVKSVEANGYQAWVLKKTGEYGVAIPRNNADIKVSESFSDAHLYSGLICLDNSVYQNALFLMAKSELIRVPFSYLCAQFIDPGTKGQFREELVNNPVNWWIQWKELLGNKNVDDRVYDVLGELVTLRYLVLKGEQPNWVGPLAATYDIECDDAFYEVKSSMARKKKEIMLNNFFQLNPPSGQKLFIVFCQFEEATTGLSINSLVNELNYMGFDKNLLNENLKKLGFECGKSARDRLFLLHAMTKYSVDNSFPAIRNSSFVDGTMPKGIMGITYTVSLDGIVGVNLLD